MDIEWIMGKLESFLLLIIIMFCPEFCLSILLQYKYIPTSEEEGLHRM